MDNDNREQEKEQPEAAESDEEATRELQNAELRDALKQFGDSLYGR